MLARAVMCLTPIVVLAAQAQLPPNNQTQVPRHSVTGTVSNAVTGEPVRRALVQMQGQTQGSVLTGPDGRFRFDDVPEGSVWLTSQKPGFFDARSFSLNEWGSMGNSSFTVDSGKNDFQLKLYPSSRIVGHVTDGDGEPVESVNIQVIAEQIQQGRKQWQIRNGAATDDDGGFRIEDLTPGRYVLLCGGRALPAMSWNGPRQVNPPMYYPDATDMTAAQVMELQPGQEFLADFHLRTERGYRVTAEVTGVQFGGLPAIENASGQRVYFYGTKSDRSITEEGVPSGTWTLVIEGGDREGHSFQTRQEFTVDHADVSGLQVQVQPNATIPVTVNHANAQTENQPAENPLVNLVNGRFMAPNIAIQAQLVGADTSRQGNNYPATLQGDPPTLRFMNIPAGKYKLEVQSFGNDCLESAMYGSVDLTRDYLVVSSNAGAQPITIDLRSDCAVLKVQVKADGRNVFAVLVPSSPFAEPIVQPMMIQPMGFAQLTLSPGTYQVFAFSSLNGLEYANPEALRNCPSQSITLDAGQQKELTLELVERNEN
jgi:hypothetical protein